MQNLRKGSGWKYFNWNVASENKNEWDKEEGKRKRLTVKGIPVEWRLDCVGSPEKHLDSLSSAAHMKNRSWNSYTLSPRPYCPLGIITAPVVSSPRAREWLGRKRKNQCGISPLRWWKEFPDPIPTGMCSSYQQANSSPHQQTVLRTPAGCLRIQLYSNSI